MRDLDLSKAKMNGVSLAGANLARASLVRADLENAAAQAADFRSCFLLPYHAFHQQLLQPRVLPEGDHARVSTATQT